MFAVSWLFTGIVHALGFEAVNRKFLRENGHLPHTIPGAKSSEEPAVESTEAAAAEESTEVAADTADDTEDAADEADDAADAAVEEAIETDQAESADW